MRKSYLALPGVLLALAAAAPASADPVRLDEAGLGGVAAGNGLSLSTSQLSNTSTSTTSTLSDVSSIMQSMTGSSVNTNYATGLASQGVTATGVAGTTVTGAIARP